TFPLIEQALKEGKRVVLPVVNKEDRRLELYFLGSMEQLTDGYWGIKEPDPLRAERAHAEGIELIVMPGVCFDHAGGRIGYGGGYYDRLISSFKKRPLLIGIAYEEQIVEYVPTEPHDHRVQAIITDRRILEV
ncbi:MAG: 5-formyltetrahydrofolate cyclo-ligase, partial [Nitrospirae bacterium]